MNRRSAIAAGVALPLAVVSRRVLAEVDPLDPDVWVFTAGRRVTPGRVTLEPWIDDDYREGSARAAITVV